jgi:hypothetical protein
MRAAEIPHEFLWRRSLSVQSTRCQNVAEQTFVLTGVPDEKKGERHIVLHKIADGQLRACLEKLAQLDLPNL